MTRQVDPNKVREYLDYLPKSGRLVRVKRVTSGKLGEPIGYVESSPNSSKPYRRSHFQGKALQTSHLVWAWHHGVWPDGYLVRNNDDSLDDRIENLAQAKDLRRPVKVAHELPSEDQPDTMIGDLPEELNTGIYEILNVKNGRRYIGSAVNVSKRWRQHLCQLDQGRHHSKFMQRCWNKNGSDNFIFRVVLVCDKENLLMYEQAFLDFYQPEYNSAKVAGSQLGHRHSKESRTKMSASHKGKASPRKGVNLSDETKRKISESKRGAKLGPYSKDRTRKAADAMRKSKGALTEDQVRLARSLRNSGLTYKEIANEIGCSWCSISDIILGRTFRWVD